jgi:hypothetical protein
VLSGAGGTGTSAICLHLPAALPACVALETAILWGRVAATPDDNYRGYRTTRLRLAKDIGQGGRPVVRCGRVVLDHWKERGNDEQALSARDGHGALLGR